MTLRHCKRVHIVVLVVPKRGGVCAYLLATHPKEHTTVLLFHCQLNTHGLHLALAIHGP